MPPSGGNRAGEGHFPLSPKDPKSVVDFITTSAR